MPTIRRVIYDKTLSVNLFNAEVTDSTRFYLKVPSNVTINYATLRISVTVDGVLVQVIMTLNGQQIYSWSNGIFGPMSNTKTVDVTGILVYNGYNTLSVQFGFIPWVPIINEFAVNAHITALLEINYTYQQVPPSGTYAPPPAPSIGPPTYGGTSGRMLNTVLTMFGGLLFIGGMTLLLIHPKTRAIAQKTVQYVGQIGKQAISKARSIARSIIKK